MADERARGHGIPGRNRQNRDQLSGWIHAQEHTRGFSAGSDRANCKATSGYPAG